MSILIATFENGKKLGEFIAKTWNIEGGGSWIIPSRGGKHVAPPSIGEFLVKVVGQTKSGNLRFCQIIGDTDVANNFRKAKEEIIEVVKSGVSEKNQVFKAEGGGVAKVIDLKGKKYSYQYERLRWEDRFEFYFEERIIPNVEIIIEIPRWGYSERKFIEQVPACGELFKKCKEKERIKKLEEESAKKRKEEEANEEARIKKKFAWADFSSLNLEIEWEEEKGDLPIIDGEVEEHRMGGSSRTIEKLFCLFKDGKVLAVDFFEEVATIKTISPISFHEYKDNDMEKGFEGILKVTMHDEGCIGVTFLRQPIAFVAVEKSSYWDMAEGEDVLWLAKCWSSI